MNCEGKSNILLCLYGDCVHIFQIGLELSKEVSLAERCLTKQTFFCKSEHFVLNSSQQLKSPKLAKMMGC